jgi:hypothetical protein
VRAAGEKPQAGRRFFQEFRLRQDAAAERDDRVGGEGYPVHFGWLNAV